MVTVALYSVESPHASIVDKFISWFSRSKYTHVELILSDGYMYSSSGRDNGVRRKKHIENDKIWTYFKVHGDEKTILSFYEKTKDCKYDMMGILGFGLPLRDRTNRWFCSEWCCNALKISGNSLFWLVNPEKTKPSDFIKILN